MNSTPKTAPTVVVVEDDTGTTVRGQGQGTVDLAHPEAGAIEIFDKCFEPVLIEVLARLGQQERIAFCGALMACMTGLVQDGIDRGATAMLLGHLLDSVRGSAAAHTTTH